MAKLYLYPPVFLQDISAFYGNEILVDSCSSNHGTLNAPNTNMRRRAKDEAMQEGSGSNSAGSLALLLSHFLMYNVWEKLCLNNALHSFRARGLPSDHGQPRTS